VLLSHTLQFAVLLATFTNLTQHCFYLCWRQRSSRTTHWDRWGPAYTVAAATVFIMVQPTYLVLHIARQIAHHGSIGAYTRQGCTVFGYVLLFAGIMWATSLWPKLKRLCGGS